MKPWFWLTILLLAGAPLQAEVLRPQSRPTDQNVLLVERTWSCHISYGAQTDRFKLEGQTLGSANRFSPLQRASQPGYLGFGCITPSVYFNYGFLDRSIRFDPEITFHDQPWNGLSYRLDQIGFGTYWSFIPHRLYWDVGMAYYITSYQFGNYPEQASDVVRSPVYKQNGTLLHSRLRYYINSFFFGSYEYLHNPSSTGHVQSSSKLGLNVMVRFQ